MTAERQTEKDALRHVEHEIQVTNLEGEWSTLRGGLIRGIASVTATVEEAREAVALLLADPYYEGVEARIVRVERTIIPNVKSDPA